MTVAAAIQQTRRPRQQSCKCSNFTAVTQGRRWLVGVRGRIQPATAPVATRLPVTDGAKRADEAGLKPLVVSPRLWVESTGGVTGLHRVEPFIPPPRSKRFRAARLKPQPGPGPSPVAVAGAGLHLRRLPATSVTFGALTLVVGVAFVVVAPDGEHPDRQRNQKQHYNNVHVESRCARRSPCALAASAQRPLSSAGGNRDRRRNVQNRCGR